MEKQVSATMSRLVSGLERVGLLDRLSHEELTLLREAAVIMEPVSTLPPSASGAYAGATAERRWSGLSDDSSGSGGTSG